MKWSNKTDLWLRSKSSDWIEMTRNCYSISTYGVENKYKIYKQSVIPSHIYEILHYNYCHCNRLWFRMKMEMAWRYLEKKDSQKCNYHLIRLETTYWRALSAQITFFFPLNNSCIPRFSDFYSLLVPHFQNTQVH